jgi:Tannase and feruloyl esterase
MPMGMGMSRCQARQRVLVAAALSVGMVLPLGAAELKIGSDVATACAALTQPIAASAIGLPSRGGTVDSATVIEATPLAIADKGPTPAARITPALPRHCRVLGRIAPVDAAAPPIRFQVNLPIEWNGRSLQYGGGGFNGVLISGLALPPAQPFDKAGPLAQGFVTYGTDSGHETKPGEPVQAFALNDEAFENFAHAAYKKVRDAAVAIMTTAYGRGPAKLYFMGSSEGGREGLTMAQRYPRDFDGVFARVPVINWTGLIHASFRSGLVTMGEGYLTPAHVKLVHDAVLAACDGADGARDELVANPVSCRRAVRLETLACKPQQAADTCLSAAQIKAVQTVRGPLRYPFAHANGVREYPGWGPSGEATPASGPTGGWNAWWLGTTPPTQPAQPTNGIGWVYGSGAMRYVFARKPDLDVTTYRAEDHRARVVQVSRLMDSTDPNLARFRARGGKLIILEYMADYAQSPYAGIRYFERMQATMGAQAVASFARLYTAPGVDHVGSGAPGNVDMLSLLVDWVEAGKAPPPLTVLQQKVEPGFATVRSLPLCQWPAWPKYRAGDATQASSFACSL